MSFTRVRRIGIITGIRYYMTMRCCLCWSGNTNCSSKCVSQVLTLELIRVLNHVWVQGLPNHVCLWWPK